MFHLAVLALDMEWYGEWVPSKANIADIMTRPERYHELERSASGSDEGGAVPDEAVHLEHIQGRSQAPCGAL